MGEKLTRSDVKKIQEEIEYRRLELRPRLLEDVKEKIGRASCRERV